MLMTVVSYVPVFILLSVVGLLTLLKDARNRINIYFALFVFSLAAWIGLLFLGDILLAESVSLWLVRTAAIFGTLALPPFLFFCMRFPINSVKVGNRFGVLASIPALIFSLLCLSPWLIPSVELTKNSAQPAGLGILYTLQSLYLVGGFIGSMVVLLLKKRRVSPSQKNQITLVIIGMAIAIAVNLLTGFVLTIMKISNNYSNLLGSVSFLIFVGFTAYAIVRHRMFDIRLAIVRTIGFLGTIILVGSVYSLVVIAAGALIITGGEVSLTQNRSSLLLLVPPTLLIALTFHGIQQLIARATRQIFYQDLYDLREVLDKFSDSLISNIEIDKIMELSLKVISDAIKPTHAYFVTFDEHGRLYKQIAHRTKAPESISELIGDIKAISDNPVAREDLGGSAPRGFVANDVFLALRLGQRDKPDGVVLFGPKQNGRAYTSQDTDLLRIGAKNLTIALDNAKRYDEISHFAETMREEVKKATAKLRAANEELKTLDTMKDDFISMASHQLRTPATSVHEALQMMNHPSMKLSSEEKARLSELAEASSEHLVTVVADMLSISRIQAGHFTFTKAQTNLVELVERVLKQTAVLAEQKNIKIGFVKPTSALMVSLDVPKINEAISNYVENAIKYSPEGKTVSVKLHAKDSKIHFEVTDQGIGVPETERKNLFGKFYRAGNARVIQPDGNGIGLFVVKSVAEGHGGDAYYKPLESGSLFGFWLPQEIPDMASEEQIR
jgi:K+-sensing histidine kinase KdpD